MCHGLIEQRATVSVPDLLRSQCYQEAECDNSGADEKDAFPINVYGSGSGLFSMIDDSTVVPESSSLSDGLSEDALADIVQDYSSAVKKFDSEDVDGVEADKLSSTGALATWFDCIKDSFCVPTDSVPTKEAKLSPQDVPVDTPVDTPQEVSNGGEKAPKSRKARKSAVKEQSHAQYDSEMDDGAPVLIDEKRKRRWTGRKRYPLSISFGGLL